MILKRGWFYALLTLVGFAGMWIVYADMVRLPDDTPWRQSFIIVGPSPLSDFTGATRTEMRMRLLPPSNRAKAFITASRLMGWKIMATMRLMLREKVVEYPGFDNAFTADMLKSGRLPVAGASEVLAGPLTRQSDRVAPMTVVGRLRDEIALFEGCYIIPAHESNDAVFADDDDTLIAQLVTFSGDKPTLDEAKQMERAYPDAVVVRFGGSRTLGPAAFYSYLAAFVVFLIGGCGVFVRMWLTLAARNLPGPLGTSLGCIARRPRLFIAVHVVAFGIMIICMAAAQVLPDVHLMLVSSVAQSLTSGKGPLGWVYHALLSRSIPLTAFAIFTVNFFLGSVAVITLPSMIVPAVGSLVMLIRPALVGMILAPGDTSLARAMLPHSWTCLIELEAYIVAVFFALLMLIYPFTAAEGPTALKRYGRALLLNVQAQLLVLAVLIVAAVYEAIEVIQMIE
jgi:hypothetical protein